MTDDIYVQMNAWVEYVLSGCIVLVMNSVTKNADCKFVNSPEELVQDTSNETMVDITLSGTCNDTWYRPVTYSRQTCYPASLV
jgi:hypothetical protein